MYVVTVVAKRTKAPITLFMWYWSVKTTRTNPTHAANSVTAIVGAINYWIVWLYLQIEIDTDTGTAKGANSSATLTGPGANVRYVRKLNGRTICLARQFRWPVRVVRREDSLMLWKEKVWQHLSAGYGCVLTSCVIAAPWQNVFVL